MKKKIEELIKEYKERVEVLQGRDRRYSSEYIDGYEVGEEHALYNFIEELEDLLKMIEQ